MKKLLLVIALLFVLNSNSFAGNCITRSEGNPTTHILARFAFGLAGELDPFTLGDAGLMLFENPFTNQKMLILENDELAPYTSSLLPYAHRGLVVAIKLSCLQAITDNDTIDAISDLVDSFDIPAPISYFSIEE